MNAVLPGRVLRAWREFAGLTAADLARAMQKERSMVSMWESGERGRKSAASLGTVEQIAARYVDTSAHFTSAHATAMVGLWSSAGTVRALTPRTVWHHNFPDPPGPVWVWLRSGAESADRPVKLAVGPFDQTLLVPEAGGGLLVHSPTSIPNPPLTVTFAEPGWADFGCGIVPAQVAQALEMALVDSYDIIGRQPARHRPLDADSVRQLRPGLSALRQVAARFKVSWSLVAPHLGDPIRPDHPAYPLDGASDALSAAAGRAATDSAGSLISQLMMPPERVRAVREGRGLSRALAAERVTGLNPNDPVADRSLENLEHDGRMPTAECALARLDMIYGADGRLGIDRTFNSRTHAGGAAGRFTLRFPSYWTGHVWLQAHGPDADGTCTMELVWGPWKRRQRVRSGCVLTTRKAEAGPLALLVSLPMGWHLAAGTGVVPGALDVNVGWRPVNLQAAWTLVSETAKTVWSTGPTEPAADAARKALDGPETHSDQVP